MAEAIDLETRQWAAQLWIEDGLTYEAVAARTGISVGGLKKWASDEGWAEKRSEYRQALRDIRSNTIKLRSSLVVKALASGHPQDVYAFAAIESIVARAAGKAAAGEQSAPITPENLREIKTPAQAIDAMQEAVERKVNMMLAAGDIDLDKIKRVNESLELIEKMRAKLTPADAQSADRDLEPETMQTIKDLYGVK